MIIKNKTSLNYRHIGEIIDKIQQTSVADTQYIGLIQVAKVKYLDKTIRIQIRYLKRYVEWYFEELKGE